MFKKITAFIVSIAMTLSLVGSATLSAGAADSFKLRVHYNRFEKDYDGWNLWIWAGELPAVVGEFTSEDEFGKVSEITLPISSKEIDKIGIIVRLNDWEAKDVEMDRFIDTSKGDGSSVDVYVVQGIEKLYYDPADIKTTPEFKSASLLGYDGETTLLDFKLTMPLKGDLNAADFTLKDSDGKTLKVLDVDVSAASGCALTVDGKLGFEKSYTLSHKDLGEAVVDMSNAFSMKEFQDANTYNGELGAIYTKEKTTFRVFAPTGQKVVLSLYTEGTDGEPVKQIDMVKSESGTFMVEVPEDLNGVYYTYAVDGRAEAVDPYAVAVGVNAKRGMVLDLDTTDPEGWENDVAPEFVSPTDAIIYEIHVRDFSNDADSGMKNKGKFLAFTETDTKNAAGDSTGIAHLKELGVTHVHLLPSFDFATVDETSTEPQFNWGYDPANFNVPEGSYSTDPYNGEVRVKEFKEMVQALHENGIRVVMDVVYNHTSSADNSNFTKIAPDYYYRKKGNAYSNGSGCGNETASERSMMRKYIVDSVKYWSDEYHVDGYRFDLMGLHDIETMNEVRAGLDEIDPSILVYGEGWTGGDSTLPEADRAIKANTPKLDSRIAAFSDDIRDGIKGNVFKDKDTGFVNGKDGMEDTIKFGIAGSTDNAGINYGNVKTGSPKAWANDPTQTISYVSAHDNLAFWDKLATANADDSVEDRVKMNKLAASIIFTSQGIPFFQAGEEILRSKVKEDGTFDANSYKSSDAVNNIKWSTKTDNKAVFEYYKGLIEFRKAHPALRMTTGSDVHDNLTFLSDTPKNTVGYTINNKPNGETAEQILVLFNGNNAATKMAVPAGNWAVYVNGEKAGTNELGVLAGGEIEVPAISSLVMLATDKAANGATNEATGDKTTPSNPTTGVSNTLMLALVIVSAAIIIATVGFALNSKRKAARK